MEKADCPHGDWLDCRHSLHYYFIADHTHVSVIGHHVPCIQCIHLQGPAFSELFGTTECAWLRGGGAGRTAFADSEFRTYPVADYKEVRFDGAL